MTRPSIIRAGTYYFLLSLSSSFSSIACVCVCTFYPCLALQSLWPLSTACSPLPAATTAEQGTGPGGETAPTPPGRRFSRPRPRPAFQPDSFFPTPAFFFPYHSASPLSLEPCHVGIRVGTGSRVGTAHHTLHRALHASKLELRWPTLLSDDAKKVWLCGRFLLTAFFALVSLPVYLYITQHTTHSRARIIHSARRHCQTMPVTTLLTSSRLASLPANRHD